MASLNFYSEFETNLMSYRRVIVLLSQVKTAKAHGKNYIKVKPHLVRYFLRNHLLHKVKLGSTFCKDYMDCFENHYKLQLKIAKCHLQLAMSLLFQCSSTSSKNNCTVLHQLIPFSPCKLKKSFRISCKESMLNAATYLYSLF